MLNNVLSEYFKVTFNIINQIFDTEPVFRDVSKWRFHSLFWFLFLYFYFTNFGHLWNFKLFTIAHLSHTYKVCNKHKTVKLCSFNFEYVHGRCSPQGLTNINISNSSYPSRRVTKVKRVWCLSFINFPTIKLHRTVCLFPFVYYYQREWKDGLNLNNFSLKFLTIHVRGPFCY